MSTPMSSSASAETLHVRSVLKNLVSFGIFFWTQSITCFSLVSVFQLVAYRSQLTNIHVFYSATQQFDNFGLI